MVIREDSLQWRFLSLGTRHMMFDPPRTRGTHYLRILIKAFSPLGFALIIVGALALLALAILSELGRKFAQGYHALVPRMRPLARIRRFLNEPVRYEALERCCSHHREERARWSRLPK